MRLAVPCCSCRTVPCRACCAGPAHAAVPGAGHGLQHAPGRHGPHPPEPRHDRDQAPHRVGHHAALLQPLIHSHVSDAGDERAGPLGGVQGPCWCPFVVWLALMGRGSWLPRRWLGTCGGLVHCESTWASSKLEGSFQSLWCGVCVCYCRLQRPVVGLTPCRLPYMLLNVPSPFLPGDVMLLFGGRRTARSDTANTSPAPDQHQPSSHRVSLMSRHRSLPRDDVSPASSPKTGGRCAPTHTLTCLASGTLPTQTGPHD